MNEQHGFLTKYIVNLHISRFLCEEAFIVNKVNAFSKEFGTHLHRKMKLYYRYFCVPAHNYAAGMEEGELK